MSTIRRLKTWQADALLILVTLMWGSTFVIVQRAITVVPTMLFLALRFDLAAVVLILFTIRRLTARSTAAAWKAGAVIGLALFVGYALQTLGLAMGVSASKTAFITGLYVVLVPVLSVWWLRREPSRSAWTGVMIATAGLAVLSVSGSVLPTWGDVLVLLCALAFAVHIVSVSKWSGPHDPVVLTVAQIGVAALLNHLFAFMHGDRLPPVISSSVLWALVLTGVLATAVAFLLQNVLQPYTTPTHTALIFTTEPVFGAVFGYILAGDVLSWRGYFGGAMIIGGMLLAELPGAAALLGGRVGEE